MIRREHGKWILRTRDGSRVLGRHETKAGAQAQERAIEAREHNRASWAARHFGKPHRVGEGEA